MHRLEREKNALKVEMEIMETRHEGNLITAHRQVYEGDSYGTDEEPEIMGVRRVRIVNIRGPGSGTGGGN